MARHSTALGLIGTGLAAALVLTAIPATVAATPSPPAWSSGVDSWVTDLNTDQRLARQPSLRWQDGAGAQDAIVVDPTRRYQTMTGFGASMTDSSAYVLSEAPGEDPDVDHDRPVLHPRGHRVVDAAAADGRLRLRGGPGVLLRRPAGREDRPRPVRLQHRPRPCVHPAAAAGGVRDQPGPHLHGQPVERTGLDEGHRLPGPGVAAEEVREGLRPVLREVRAGVREGGHPHRLRVAAERAAVRAGGLPRAWG